MNFPTGVGGNPTMGGSAKGSGGGLGAQFKTAWSLDSVNGSNVNSGDWGNGPGAGSPIKTISALIARTDGYRQLANSTLYVAQDLSASESALFDQFKANSYVTWRVVSGQMPVTPKFWFDARNINGLNNVGLVNNQSLAAVNWKNLGAAVGGDAVPTGAPIFKLVASAGKVRNCPSVSFDGASFFRTGAVAGLVSPITWVTVMRVNDNGARAFADGRTGGTRNMWYASGGGWALYGGSGTGLPGAIGLPTLNKYHNSMVAFIPHAANAAVNGNVADQASGPFDEGVCTMVDGVTLGAGGDGSAPLLGELVAVLGLDTGANQVDMTAFDQWFEYHFGTGFPQ